METSTSHSGKSGSGDNIHSGSVESSVNVSDLSVEKIHEIVELEKLKTQSHVANLAFQERRLAADLELAKVQINRQAEIAQGRQQEARKGIIAIGMAFLFSLLLVVAFIGW